MFTINRKVLLTAAAAAAVLAAGSGIAAHAASTGGTPATTVNGCISGQNRIMENAYVNSVPDCGMATPFRLTAGTAGPRGPQGPSGVQQVITITAAATLANIGGSWTTGHTPVTTIPLSAGAYLVTLTGDFYKTAATTATPVLQIQFNGASRQLTGYTGEFPYDSAEAVGTGSDGTPNGLEQTATAVGIITMTAAGTAEIDAFGYNPDRGGEGGGDFAVNATISIIQLTPA